MRNGIGRDGVVDEYEVEIQYLIICLMIVML